ncbi:cation channel sperm-associated protein 1 [Neomonachus schauinslandi]|uniref:Cation channel sperm-associated protein 1 n=1 Tax=Neomonachus schauinslandi TaxID=29088 RepID=A0A8M1MS08_NEOSC|nr:cation channel sperm-associated protein 1 [Neomonachus schauinslandi]
MDQSSLAETAQNEADTNDLDVLSHPGSPTPHHRPGHSGVHRHHGSHHHGTSHHHGESHHHGGSHHLDEFQDFHDNAPSHHSPHSHHHGEAHHHGRAHHLTSLALAPSHSTIFSHHSLGEGPFDGNPTTMVGLTTMVRFPTIVGSITKPSSHHSYADAYHDRSIPHFYDNYRNHSEHHRGHHGHHGHHGEHHHGHHSKHHHGHHIALQPSMVQAQRSAFSLTRSHSAVRSHASQGSSKVHPQDSSSKTSSESWAEEDEQFQKRRTTRAQRAHRRLHTVDLFYRLWEKLSYLIKGLRRMLRNLTQSLPFEAFIFLVVCLNTTMLVAQTFAEVEIRGEWFFMALDSIFLCIYVVEAALKITALGFKYFSDSWNNLDFFIMIMAMLDFMLLQYNSSSFVYHQSVFRIFKVFKSLRALRAIRVLRRLSFLTSLQEVTGTLARSLPSITAILILMFTCLFLFSVVLRALFRHSDPKRFQSILSTIFTLFTMLTLDDWSLIYLDSRAQGAWYIIPILMIYIIIQYFIFLNLVIAVLVDNFQMALLKGLEKVKQERAARIHEKLLDDPLTELSKSDPEEVVSEHTKQKQLIEKKFGTMTEKQRELLFHFLQLVASVEHHQQKFRSQASVLDEIVDAAFEAGEEDFRK